MTPPADVNSRLDAAIGRYGPFVALAIGAVLTASIGFLAPTAVDWARIGALVAASAAWSFVFAFRRGADGGMWATRPAVGAVYVPGMVVLIAALVAASPWFAFLAVPGYAHAHEYLRGRWRYVGMSAVAVLHAWAIVGGGWSGLGAPVIIGTLLIAALIAPTAISFIRLDARVREESGRRAEVIEELNQALDENAVLHARLIAQARETGIVDERARLAREIHDTIAQGLTGIVTQLEAAGAADDPQVRRRHVDVARSLARESLTEARRSVQALAPGPLADAHLPDAITAMAKAWAETSGVGVHVDTTGDPRPLLPDVEVALFRVAQEALANVGKHAEASRVGLTLSYMDDVVVLDVRDDGRGFDPAARPGPSAGHGFGLAAMEQRVRRVSGTLDIESAPGDGTAISATVPALRPEETL